MREAVSREFIYFAYYCEVQFEQIAPYYVYGTLIGSLISVFAKERIHALFVRICGSDAGVLGVIPASALGIASPLCMYGTIPLAASFSRCGVGDDWLAAFMMSSILLNPQLIAYSAALGTTVLCVRVISCFFTGIAAGLCVRYFFGGKFFSFDGFAEPENRDTDSSIIIRFIKNVWRNIRATGPMFLLGIFLAALFMRYVPQDGFAALFGERNGFGVLMAATVGVPLYACGGGTIPLLREWLADGMSVGAAAAFMISGPATKITNLGAVKIVLGAKRFALYLAFVMLASFISGIAADVLAG